MGNKRKALVGAVAFMSNIAQVDRISNQGQGESTGWAGGEQFQPLQFPREDGERLGIYTVLQSGQAKAAAARRIERYTLQAAARELLPGERVGVCHSLLVPGKATVDIWHSGTSGRAYYKNLVSCALLWVCPVCAAKISERRRVELQQCIAVSPFYTFTLGTVTVQHCRGDGLASVLGVLREAWKKTKAGRGWQEIKQRFGFVGYITALEVTYGKNGWHPHLHILFVGKSSLSEADRAELQVAIADRFGGYVVRLGGYVSEYHGVEISGPDAACEYVSKWGIAEELTKASSKRARADVGRNPFDLLRLYVAGDLGAGVLFQEYAAAMKGRQQLQWSPGLRDIFGLNIELTDQEAAEEQVSASDVLLSKIPLAGWRIIVANHLRGQLLEVASSGDASALAAWLLEYGIEV